MSDLLVLAVRCDLTRVFSVQWSGGVNMSVYWQVGATTEHHALTHNEAGNQPQVQQCEIHSFIVGETVFGLMVVVGEALELHHLKGHVPDQFHDSGGNGVSVIGQQLFVIMDLSNSHRGSTTPCTEPVIFEI